VNKPNDLASDELRLTRVERNELLKGNETMKTKLIIGVMALFAVPAFAGDLNLNCPAGTTQVGGPNSRMESAGCATTAANGERSYTGPFIVYWTNGMKQAEGTMANNQRVGLWTTFDKTGVKTGEVTFKADQWDGQRVKFHANGQKQLVETYNAGERVAVAYFNTLGQPVARDGVTLQTK